MSELPGRPNLDQLRRQARELLRAAADGEPSALTRIRAVSARVSLSTAQLAVAREYGFASWPALHAEVERRLAALPAPGDGAGRPGARWSFGGATAIEMAAGTLYPGVLVAGPGRATLNASLMPAGRFQDRLTMPPLPMSNSVRMAREQAKVALAQATISAVALTDDQGTTYALHDVGIAESPGRHGPERELVSLSLDVEVDPVPARERGWLELRGQDGSVARLVPSPRPDARVSGLAPLPEGPAARELSDLGLDLIGLSGIDQLIPFDQDDMERYCSEALARAAEIQQSAAPGTAGDLPGQLARLCAFLTGRGPADGLPREWSGIISAANLADGTPRHLDISAALPPVDDIVMRVDSLVFEPESWKMYLCAEPSWWTYSADGNRKWAVMRVHAVDDLGGLYVSQYDGGSSHDGREELALRFLPRLNPLARTLTLTFTHAAEQVTIEVQLPGR
jgi:hypothetical protein